MSINSSQIYLMMLKFARRILKSTTRFIPFLGPIKKTVAPIREIASAPPDKQQWMRPQTILIATSLMLLGLHEPVLFIIFTLASAWVTFFVIRPKAPGGSEERVKYLPSMAGLHLFFSFMMLMHMLGGPI